MFMRLVIIDSFEEDYAVCQTDEGEILEIEKAKIPTDAKEGDVLVLEGDEISINKEETIRLRQQIKKLMQDLWEE